MATTSRDRQDGTGESGASRGNSRGGGGNGRDRTRDDALGQKQHTFDVIKALTHSDEAGAAAFKNASEAGKAYGKQTTGDGGNLNPDGTYKNPRKFGKLSSPAASTPNFPNTDGLVAASAVVDSLMSASPLGMAGLVGRSLRSATTGKPMSSGMAMDAALAMGGSLGEQDGMSGVGHDFSMDHEAITLGQADRARAKTADGTNGDSASPVVDALYGDGEYSDVRLKDRRKGRSSDVSAALQMLQVA